MIMNIKEQFEKTEKLYHFTSFDTAKIILESNRLRFGRLNNMNDIHENDKIVFHDENGGSVNERNSDILDVFYDEIYKYRQISFTADNMVGDKVGFDLHQMWGMYADKGESVCLVFDKDEMEKNCDMTNIHKERVKYDKILESSVVSLSQKTDAIPSEVKNNVHKIFFHKRIEWEHEQEYRLIKKCHNTTKEEYLLLGQSLRFIILSSKLRNIDDVRYFNNIRDIQEAVKKVEEVRNMGNVGTIPVLIYGNGLLDYSLCLSGEEVIWNSKDRYNILKPCVNCNLGI